MTKKLKTAILAAATVVCVSSLMYTASASSDTAGSSSDPLVTKSYVDSSMANVISILNSGGQESALPSSEGGFEPVHVDKGQILIGKGGAEIILRSGSALSYSESSDGIIDTTLGIEYHNGDTLEANHLLIVSRDDGRGAAVSSDDGAWFIVKGGYTIK
ncbi:hypothetical protein MUJ63_10605 [Lachnospiraceae bacterium NSJ-143]|nr:hypothetical protein [Lachnospiraceae bacterium NSJ-143]